MRRYGWFCGLMLLTLLATSAQAQRRTPQPESSSAVATSTPIMRVTTENPREINLGKPATFVIGISNAGKTPASGVIVTTQIPEHVEVTSADPKPVQVEGRTYRFQVGDLNPGATQRVTLIAVPKALQPVKLDTTVLFATSTRSSLMVRKPQLQSSVKAPTQVVVDQPISWLVRITNSGDGPAENVQITPKLVSGEVKGSSMKSPVAVGTLKAGESKEVKFTVVPTAKGKVTGRFVSTNTDGLEATSESTFQVLQAELALKAIGPAIQPIGRDSIYEIQVTNPGDASTGSTLVSVQVPAGLEITSAAENAYSKSTRTLRWRITTVRPNDNVKLRFRAETRKEGAQPFAISAQSERVKTASLTHTIDVISRPNLVVTFSNNEELSAIGEPITFRATIINAGSKAANGLKIRVELAKGMEAVASNDYELKDGHIHFPAKKLGSGERTSVAFRTVGRSVGDHRVKLIVGDQALTTELAFEGSAFCYSEKTESKERTTQDDSNQGSSPRVTNRPGRAR